MTQIVVNYSSKIWFVLIFIGITLPFLNVKQRTMFSMQCLSMLSKWWDNCKTTHIPYSYSIETTNLLERCLYSFRYWFLLTTWYASFINLLFTMRLHYYWRLLLVFCYILAPIPINSCLPSFVVFVLLERLGTFPLVLMGEITSHLIGAAAFLHECSVIQKDGEN